MAVGLALAAMPHGAWSQGAAGGSRDQAGASRPGLTMQRPLDQSGLGIVRDALGRPCLDVEAAARPELVNPDMLDHVVSIKNNCVKLIKAKVCYYGSDHCNDIVLPAYKRVDTILGTMRGVSYFRYRIEQK